MTRSPGLLGHLLCLSLVVVLAPVSHAELPSLINTIYCDTNGTYFGWEIIPLGDQNGDGFDDFLTLDSRQKSFLYLGGDPGDSTPFLVFGSTRAYQANIGDYNEDGFDDFVIPTGQWSVKPWLSLHFGGPVVDTLPEYLFGLSSFPCDGPVAYGRDVNQNGTAELMGVYPAVIPVPLIWFELDSEPDSIPDLVFYPGVTADNLFLGDAVIVGDLNGDGHDDLVLNLRGSQPAQTPGQVNLYWGGPLFDTIPDLVLERPGGYVLTGDDFGSDLALLGDVNGDGYVDLWAGQRQHGDSLRCIYFGGPDIDTIPEIVLPYGDVCDKGLPAGDVNQDGYVDLMTGFTSPYSGLGWVKIYFGGPSMDNLADATIDVVEMPGLQYDFAHGFGPLGDYNGDGIDDFGIASYASLSRQVIYVFSGWGEPVGISDETDPTLASRFILVQNYPNPFNAQTSIRYEVPIRTHVRVIVHDILGREVKVLVDHVVSAGLNSITWNGTDYNGNKVASGVYLCRLTAMEGSIELTQKMLLLK